MRKSRFKQPKNVLIFNGARTLISITRSLQAASLLTGGNLQAISFCCLGRYISTGGFYYRHIHPDIEIDLTDLNDSLNLEEYDRMCGEKRRYHTVREMARRRIALEDKRKLTTKTKNDV